jgi:hypothetical protein
MIWNIEKEVFKKNAAKISKQQIKAKITAIPDVATEY